jgi:hypothetical protein
MGKRRSQRFVDDLIRTSRKPSLELDALNHYWPAVQHEFDRKRRLLDREIPKDDPIRLAVDLLGPIKRRDGELLHTQALAYLLDPSSDHGLGTGVLAAILRRLGQRVVCRAQTTRILRLLERKDVKTTVTPEYHYKVEGFRERSSARPDIWIDIDTDAEAALIIIENKINAPESNHQLAWCERKARQWCKREQRKPKRAFSLLIFIASDRRDVKSSEFDEWAVLPYVELAAALRTVWKRRRRAVGRPWLGLYIASITRGLLGLDVSSSANTDLTEIEVYLGGPNNVRKTNHPRNLP